MVSIIIPCFNQAAYLSDNLNSIIAQTYKDWECLIINDGSTDNTEIIALEYQVIDIRIKYYKIENSGLSNARNYGLEIANGNYIQLLDCDDLIEKNKINCEIKLYESGLFGPDIIIYSSMRYFENDYPNELKIVGRNHFVAHVEIHQLDSLESQKELLRSKNPFVISAPLYPKAIFDNVGLFDTSLTALEDWDLHIRCVENKYKFHHHYEKNTLTLIRLHNSSMMRNQPLMDENFYKLIIKHQIRETPIIHRKRSMDYIKDYIPPILLKVSARIFRKSK